MDGDALTEPEDVRDDDSDAEPLRDGVCDNDSERDDDLDGVGGGVIVSVKVVLGDAVAEREPLVELEADGEPESVAEGLSEEDGVSLKLSDMLCAFVDVLVRELPFLLNVSVKLEDGDGVGGGVMVSVTVALSLGVRLLDDVAESEGETDADAVDDGLGVGGGVIVSVSVAEGDGDLDAVLDSEGDSVVDPLRVSLADMVNVGELDAVCDPESVKEPLRESDPPETLSVCVVENVAVFDELYVSLAEGVFDSDEVALLDAVSDGE